MGWVKVATYRGGRSVVRESTGAVHGPYWGREGLETARRLCARLLRERRRERARERSVLRALKGAALVLLVAAVVGCGTTRPSNQYWWGDLGLVNMELTEPLEIHRGAWEDVRRCLGDRANDRTVDDAEWIVADSIRDEARGIYVYGAAVRTWSAPGWVVVIERAQWDYVHTVSHEGVHIIGGVSDHRWEYFRCAAPSQVDLPLRLITDEG